MTANSPKDLNLYALEPAMLLASIKRGGSFLLESHGVIITVDEEKNQALVEQSAREANIMIGNEKIYDVGVVKTGQSFSIDAKKYVLMESKRVYLNAASPDAVQSGPDIAALQDRISSFVATNEVMSPQIRNVAKGSFFSLMILASLGAAKLATSVFTEKLSVAAQPIIATNSNAETETVPVLLPETIEKPKMEEAPKPKDAVPATAKARVQEPKQPNPVNGPKVDPAIQRQQAQMFEEYLLESRFDPEGAKRKIKQLAVNVQRGTDLSKRIHHYLGTTH